MAKDGGPTASTLETMIDKPSRSVASAKACSAASTVSAMATFCAPAILGTGCRSSVVMRSKKSSLVAGQALQIAGELESVLQETDIHGEGWRPHRLDLGYDD